MERVELVLINSWTEETRVVSTHDSWKEGRRAAKQFAASENAKNAGTVRWTRVFHTLWVNERADADARAGIRGYDQLGVRPVSA